MNVWNEYFYVKSREASLQILKSPYYFLRVEDFKEIKIKVLHLQFYILVIWHTTAGLENYSCKIRKSTVQ